MGPPTAAELEDQRRAAAALEGMIGAPVAVTARPHVEWAGEDAIRNFALAYGDDNPLFVDPWYASASVRAGQIAPPLFPIATGRAASVAGAAAEAARPPLQVLGRGTIQVTAETWRLAAPIRPGLRLWRRDQIAAVSDGEPGTVAVTVRSEYVDADREDATCYAVHDRQRRYTLGTSGAPPTPPELARYGDEDLAAIGRAYEAEAPRGARTRFADDVAAGEPLPPLVKGPLTVTDLVNHRAGVGPGPLGAESLRLGYRNRQAHPRLYDRNDLGVYDNLERRHWDHGYAVSLGYPSAYDYSHTRPVWISHLLTDWAGDGGWVAQLRTSLEGFNYLGDTHWVRGEVRDVVLESDHGRVAIDVWTDNQRGETTCRGSAVVLLPRPPRRCATPTGDGR